jgi:hypothetical protein
MNFDKRYLDSGKSISDRDTSVGESSGVNQDKAYFVDRGLMDTLYKSAFCVGLQMFGIMSPITCHIRK